MSEYTGEVVVVLAALTGVDLLLLRTRLILRRRFWLLLTCIAGGTFLFDGYLDARPVVLYGWRFLSGVQLWKVPVEDFGYGFAMAAVAVMAWELLGRWDGAEDPPR